MFTNNIAHEFKPNRKGKCKVCGLTARVKVHIRFRNMVSELEAETTEEIKNYQNKQWIWNYRLTQEKEYLERLKRGE